MTRLIGTSKTDRRIPYAEIDNNNRTMLIPQRVKLASTSGIDYSMTFHLVSSSSHQSFKSSTHLVNVIDHKINEYNYHLNQENSI